MSFLVVDKVVSCQYTKAFFLVRAEFTKQSNIVQNGALSVCQPAISSPNKKYT